MRIVVMGDGAWATNSLIALRDAGHDIAAVWLRTRPTDDGLERAARAMAVPILQPPRVNAPECVASLAAAAPDLLLSIAYDQILGAAIRAAAPWCLNVHAGKLPAYRGRNIVNWAIINGEREAGLTVHCMDDGIDTGDIVLQRTLPIAWTDTYADLLTRIVAAIPPLLVDAVALVASGRAQPRPQPAGGTYFGGRRDGDEWIDWSRPSAEIYNLVRGITRPGPGARSWIGGDPIIIWGAAYDPRWPRYRCTPGEVVGRARGESDSLLGVRFAGPPLAGVLVKTGDSTLLLREVQMGAGAPETPRWPIGTRLGLSAGAILHDLLAQAGMRQKAAS